MLPLLLLWCLLVPVLASSTSAAVAILEAKNDMTTTNYHRLWPSRGDILFQPMEVDYWTSLGTIQH
jgi:hypothetical protein